MIVRRKKSSNGAQSFSFLIEIGDPDIKSAIRTIYARCSAPVAGMQFWGVVMDTLSEKDLIQWLLTDYEHFPYSHFGNQVAEQIARFIIKRASALKLIIPCDSTPGHFYFNEELMKKRGRPSKDEK